MAAAGNDSVFRLIRLTIVTFRRTIRPPWQLIGRVHEHDCCRQLSHTDTEKGACMAEVSSGSSITVTVNGVERLVQPLPGATLLEVLRDEMSLTGAKRGCDDGTCGTCTVHLNGRVVRACRVPPAQVADGDVRTVEGLANSTLHPLQEAFIENDAVQCGFCTPGMLMSAEALLGRNPSPNRDQIAQALGSNLCRCTGYLSIIDAVASVSGSAPVSPPISSVTPVSSVPRSDAEDKVCGNTLYAADIVMPGMLHGAILRSPHTHADLVRIDTSRAAELPGVLAVVTSEDVPGLNRYGRAVKDQPVLADDRVRQVGDPVAAVAAESPEIARAALALINVEYRVLPDITDPRLALDESVPTIQKPGNMASEKVITWGAMDREMDAADVVLEESYATQWIEHAYLEPDSVVAYRGNDGVLIIRTTTQHSFLHRDIIAETMGLPDEKVRILPTTSGGAFGGKTDVSCQAVAALLALRTERPIKIVYNREETFTSTVKRHRFEIQCRTGATSDGRLTALDADLLADTGAYASAAPNLFIRAGLSITGPYQFLGGTILGRAVYTNNTLAGAMRGFGAPQVVFAIESQMDDMACRLGIDPLEFRLMNRRTGDDVGISAEVLAEEAAFVETVEAVRPYYESARSAAADFNAKSDGRYRRGIGVACMRYGVGASGKAQTPGRASLELGRDGQIRLLTGATDLGQGSDMALSLIASEELSISPAGVSVLSGDTFLTADAGPTTGSRLVYYVGNAVKDAGVRLRSGILSTASELLERPADALGLRDGSVVVISENGSSSESLSFAEIARARESARLPLRFDSEFYPDVGGEDPRTGAPSPYAVYVTATHLAEVEVDTERGGVRVIRVVAAHDVGRAIFPQGMKGQIEGAVSMGIGLALKEEYIPGETVDFKGYKILSAREMPEVVTLLIELGDPSSPLKAKGVAECATVAVAPAILNAINDATGARVRQLPASPERLLALLAEDG